MAGHLNLTITDVKIRSKNKKAVATTRLVMQKGLEIKAQLQKYALKVKLSSFDMRKVGEEWKLQVCFLSCKFKG